ncbi:LUD domain-containing protein [Streptomyces sp. NBC_00090]|uniref:LutC/YkgG family protein n=1 Tax=Streptomyces sp. NBC_00090 TaxID=2903619 RepID=UPI0032435C7C
MSSKEQILTRVRKALAGPACEDVPYEQAIGRGYLTEHGGLGIEEQIELLAENLADYRAIVHRCTAQELPVKIATLLAGHGSRSTLVPSGLDPSWMSAATVEQVLDEASSTPHELNQVHSVVTACAVAVAETGTIVLDGGPDQGRRRITLMPDHHVCVVRVPDQVVASVPQALVRLDPARPQTWISGPSATSDIELDRVEGVHGPRTLEVVLMAG